MENFSKGLMLAMFSRIVRIFFFQEYGNIVENCFNFDLNVSSFVCIVSVIGKNVRCPNKKLYTKNAFLAKWHGIKTKHTCTFGESGIGRASSGWKFPELTSLRSVSHPRCVQSRTHLPASMFIIN